VRRLSDGLIWTIYDPRDEMEQFFEFRYRYREDDVEIITESTCRESMTITRRVLWDGRIEERYDHSAAGARTWIHPSEDEPAPGFGRAYQEWFPAGSELVWNNPLARYGIELFNSPTFTDLVEEIRQWLIDAGYSPPQQKLPKFFRAICGLAGSCAALKCTFGGGPSNAICGGCVGVTAGCGLITVIDAVISN
jgi:hypothetical protein